MTHHLRKMHFRSTCIVANHVQNVRSSHSFRGSYAESVTVSQLLGLSGRARMFPSSAVKLLEDAITCSNVPCIDFIEVVYPVPIWYGFCHDAWKHVIAQVCHLVLRIYKFFAILHVHQKVSLSMSYIARNRWWGGGGRIAATWKMYIFIRFLIDISLSNRCQAVVIKEPIINIYK